MKQPQNRQVNGKDLKIYYLGPSEQIRFIKFMMKTVGSPMGALKDSDASIMDSKVDAKLIGLFMEKLVDSFDEEAIITWSKKLLTMVEVDGKKMNMEIDFQGELLFMFKVLKEVLEVNFGDFLSAGTGLLGLIKSKMALVRK